MFGQCINLVSGCLYGEGDWTVSPDIPASQPIPGLYHIWISRLCNSFRNKNLYPKKSLIEFIIPG